MKNNRVQFLLRTSVQFLLLCFENIGWFQFHFGAKKSFETRLGRAKKDVPRKYKHYLSERLENKEAPSKMLYRITKSSVFVCAGLKMAVGY